MEVYHLDLRIKCASKARILRIKVKSFLVGQKFDSVVRVTNFGKEIFPGGTSTFKIIWPSGQSLTVSYEIPRLAPNETYEQTHPDLETLAPGYILFFSKISSVDNRQITLTSGPEGLVLDEGFPLYHVVAKNPEEIYEYYAMLIAAFSLFMLMVERLIAYLLSFFV